MTPSPRRVVPAGWPGTLAQSIGQQVRRYRTERGLSAEKLAQDVTALGYDYTRAQVTNLETGYRESVTIAELMAIAECLGVPPLLLLLFAADADGEVERLPGQRGTAMEAADWFTGQPNAAVTLAAITRLVSDQSRAAVFAHVAFSTDYPLHG